MDDGDDGGCCPCNSFSHSSKYSVDRDMDGGVDGTENWVSGEHGAGTALAGLVDRFVTP